jgi:hypothetical protein
LPQITARNAGDPERWLSICSEKRLIAVVQHLSFQGLVEHPQFAIHDPGL